MGAPPLVGGAGLGSSLTSTGGLTSAGSTLRSSELAGGMRGREGERGRGLGAIGTIKLGSDAISTKFEEEDEEDEESSSVSARQLKVFNPLHSPTLLTPCVQWLCEYKGLI